METKMTTMAMLLTILLAITTTSPPCHAALDQSPQAVETWFRHFPSANRKLTKLNFFIHDIMIGAHPTTVPIDTPTQQRRPYHFGKIMVMDSPLTVGPDPTSGVIGRCEGIFTFASQEEIGLVLTLNFVFTDGKYSGSTLSILGNKRKSDRYREYPVVGGSGVFRMAEGVAVDQAYNGSVGPGIRRPTQCQVMVRHYDVDEAEFAREII